MRYIYIIFSLISTTAFAQSQAISLETAIATALENRSELKTQTLRTEFAAAQDAKIKAAWQPQVNATADLRYNALLQKSVIPIGKFGFPNVPSDEVATVAFGTPFNGLIGADATQKLYDANTAIDRKINANQVAIAQNGSLKIKNELTNTIIANYFSAIFAQEKLKFVQNTVARQTANIQDITTKISVGTAVQRDLERFEIERTNADLNLKKAREDADFALRKLQYEMQTDKTIAISDNLATVLQKFEAELSTLSSKNQPTSDILEESLLQKGNALNAEKALKRNSPTVSAYANASVQALNLNIAPFAYLGVRASVPLYDGKQAQLAANDFKLQQDINTKNIEKLERDRKFELETADLSIAQAKDALKNTQVIIKTTQSIYESDKFRFQRSNITENELKSTEFLLQTAENNYLSAVYNVLVAQLNKYKVLNR
jgi:outer membrane protein